ncbi:MAG: AI-2E family transporter [Erysipelotrichaceae bacterium]|nr:AI-2E family transporter [Erysipelotrichaceae bacterium]
MDLKSKEIRRGLIYIGFAFLGIWVLMNQALILNMLSLLFNVISPFILGLAIAFVFNAPMVHIEKALFQSKFFLKKLPKSSHRILSYLITLILITLVLGGFILAVVPSLTKTLIDFINAVPQAISDLETWITQEVKLQTDVGLWLNSINFDWEVVKANILLFAQNSVNEWLNSSLILVSGIFNTFITLTIAFVFSIYVLLSKESLAHQIRLILKAFMSPSKQATIYKVASQAQEIYSSFVYGQVVEAGIVGVIFFVVLTLLNYPYAILISTIIAFTALIPMVGAMIGMAVGMILIATIDPIQALWFFVVFQVLQQLENNLIYPNVVGKKIGLPAIWVLVAITIGGSLFGVLGIVLSIPTFTLFYVLFREQVSIRVAQKEQTK